MVVLIGGSFAEDRRADGYGEGKAVDLRLLAVGERHAAKLVLGIGSLDWDGDLYHDP